MSKGVLGLQ